LEYSNRIVVYRSSALPPPLTQTPRAVARPDRRARSLSPVFAAKKSAANAASIFACEPKIAGSLLTRVYVSPATAVTTKVTAKSRSDDTGRRQMPPRRRHWSSQFATAATLQVAAFEMAATL
jgi:hypothetical protein